jgi:hypothetical protein
MIDLSALRALCEQATPGPWRTYRCSSVDYDNETASACGIDGPPNKHGHDARICYDASYDECHHVMSRADADLIAAARTALPALIDEVSRLRGEVERMRTVAVKLIECFDDGSLQVDHTDADTDPLRPVPVCGDDHDACSRETCPAVWVVNDAARIIEHRFNGPTAISTARKASDE